jgi:hypothetical protein
MHGLTTIAKLNHENTEAARILNARDPGKKTPFLQRYGKGATTEAAPVVLNAATGQPQAA